MCALFFMFYDLMLNAIDRWANPSTRIYGVNLSLKKVRVLSFRVSVANACTAEEEEESSDEESEEEEPEPAPTDGMQTPSGLESTSGMASVVSTVAGGLETPDFLELRKHSGRSTSEAVDTGPRSLYQVVPEKQTAVRGLMGSERGYDVSAVASAPIPVLGEERGTKVGVLYFMCAQVFLRMLFSAKLVWTFLSMLRNWRVCRRTNCDVSTICILEGLLVSLARTKRTIPTWWRKK